MVKFEEEIELWFIHDLSSGRRCFANMGGIRKKRRRGVTLVEVIVGALIIAVIVLAALNFQMYCALHTREADVRATAGRLGLLLLEAWKTNGVDVTAFNPTAADFNLYLPDNFSTNSEGLGGTGVELGRYDVTLDGVNYYVTLLYSAGSPQMLSACVAWNRDNYRAGDLGSNPQSVWLTSYAIY